MKAKLKPKKKAILELLEDYGCISEGLRSKISKETDQAALKK